MTIESEPRSVTGKKVKALRRQGITPLHLYGRGTTSLNLQAPTVLVQRLVTQAGGNVPVSVSIKGAPGAHFAFARQIQRHPVTDALLHVDFYQVPTTEVMRAEVPIHLVGEAPAARVHGGTLLQAIHSLAVECLPLDIPPFIEVDVSGLDDYEKAIHVSSLNLGERVTIVTEPGELIARVNPPRVVAEAVPAEAAPATEEGAPEEAAAQPSEEEGR
ncbi:MAG: 50S ribosomal protein L25 [Chloroflexi bacterium]|nr:50S ribosomal protein L25 [Chloroflexota bacterium]